MYSVHVKWVFKWNKKIITVKFLPNRSSDALLFRLVFLLVDLFLFLSVLPVPETTTEWSYRIQKITCALLSIKCNMEAERTDSTFGSLIIQEGGMITFLRGPMWHGSCFNLSMKHPIWYPSPHHEQLIPSKVCKI